MANIFYDSQTTKYAPGLAYTMPTGTIPANVAPDVGDAAMVVPMTLTTYTSLTSRPKVNVVNFIPALASDYNAFGGAVVVEGPKEFPKVQLEGHIDTPLTADGSFMVPTMVIDGIRMHYLDYMIAAFEGRAIGTTWGPKVEPVWFRDSYGRRWDSVKVLDISGSYVEAVPTRTNFSMSLILLPDETF